MKESCMYCPVCKTFLQFGAHTCSHCGADLTVLQSFDEIKKEWQQTTADISTRLNRLQARFASFEALIVSRLLDRPQSAQSPSASPQIKSPISTSSSDFPSQIDSDMASKSEEAPPSKSPPPEWPPDS